MSLAREPLAHGLEQTADLHPRREAGRTPGPGAAAQLLALQRSAGNRAAVRAVQRRTAPARSPGSAPATVVLERGQAMGSTSTEQSRSAETTNDRPAGSPQLAPAATGVPVQRGVWDTITGAVSSVASGVRDRVLGRVAGFARRLPGYELLCTIMGRDVVTGTAVPRTSAALITGFLGLIPGSDRIRGPLQESGAIERAGQWLDAEVPKLGLSWDMISGLFRRAWESLGAGDLLDPMGAWQRIAGIFAPPLARLRDFAIGAGRKMLEFVFEGAMALAGGAGGAVMGIIRRAGTVFDQIVADPIAFGANLIAAIRGGLQAFLSNVGTHLRNGLIGWLTGALGGVIRIPQQFNLAGILGMAMDFLGVTWDRVKGKLARLVGDRVVNALERGAGIVHDIYERGLAAITDRIAQFTEGIVDTVLGGIREWVTNSVVGAAITRLLSMFNPAGAVIQAIIAVYNTIQFFIERAQQLGSLAHAIFDSIAAIASGGVSGAIRSVEQALARGVPVVLGFLSRLIGLGDIAAPVRGIMQRVQGVIDSALDRVVGWIAGLARRAGGALGIERERAQQGGAAQSPARLPTADFSAGRELHTLSVEPSTGRILLASEVPEPVEVKLGRRYDTMRDRWSSAEAGKASDRQLPDRATFIARVSSQVREAERRIGRAGTQAPAAASAAYASIRPLIADLLVQISSTGSSATAAGPGVVQNIGRIAPWRQNRDSNRTDPDSARHLEAEHVIDHKMLSDLAVSAGFLALTEDDKLRQHTIMIYKSAADAKNAGVGGAFSSRSSFQSLLSRGTPVLRGLNAESRRDRARLAAVARATAAGLSAAEAERLGRMAARKAVADWRSRAAERAVELRQSFRTRVGATLGALTGALARTVRADHPGKEGPRNHGDSRPTEDQIRHAAQLQVLDVVDSLRPAVDE